MPRRPALAILLALLAASPISSVPASADEFFQATRLSPRPRPRAVLGTQAAGDTVFIGHVQGATGLPGTPGGHGPHHVGRGGNRQTSPLDKGGASNNGYWNWDDLNPGETDPWQGWWSVALPHQHTGNTIRNDWWRCFSALDFGNDGCHAGNPGKPTYGVTGYWHRDPGIAAGPANVAHRPQFTPLGGTASAWCGLRAHGDLTVTDPVTGGAYNSSIVQYYGDNHALQFSPYKDVSGPPGGPYTGGTDMNFPGYGDQWDQMLYRDVFVADGAGLSLSYAYAVRLAAGHATNPLTRMGWFLMDPLLDIPGLSTDPLTKDGNFISSSYFYNLGSPDLAPEDSFMVYVGVPVDDAAVTYTDGSVGPVGDPLRRWFSEVLRIDGWTPGGPGVGDQWPGTLVQLVSQGPGNVSGTANFTLTNAQVQPILDAQPGAGGMVRIVFRVKTNRGWSDEDTGFNGVGSGGRGAAIVDDVVVNGWAPSNGDFEAVGSIDNGVAASAAWRSTGKPVGEDWWELRDLATLTYEDPCGVVGAPNRHCNMFGNVMSVVAGDYATNTMDRDRVLVSPTINLCSAGPGLHNGMGIDSEIADVTGDILLTADVYLNLLQFGLTGSGARVAWQSYPATQPNGVTTWGTLRKTLIFSMYSGLLGCFGTSQDDFAGLIPPGGDGAYANGLIATTNATGIPDSIRASIEVFSVCYRRPAIPSVCDPNGQFPVDGFYVDNVSMAFADATPLPNLASTLRHVWNDAFPANSGLEAGTDAFRRGTVQVRSGYNSAQGTGDLNRNVIPGDTMLVLAYGSPVRTDLVFRIKPGPGNYQVIGDPTSGIRRDPATAITATPGDGSFWGSYMADRGLYGTGYSVGVPTTVPNPMTDRFAGGGLDWDPDQWVSARMDTAERNLFDCDGSAANVSGLRSNEYMSAYHESELGPGAPRATLGVVKNRCVLIDVAPGSSQTQANVDCGSGTTPAHPSGATWADRWNSLQPNNYVTAIGGYVDGSCNGPCATGTTAEFTKIIPDNQLTPGAHVEWFFRRTFEGNFADWEMVPDTTLIVPNAQSFDGMRWYSMNALPDEWKNPAYDNFGYPASNGMACMLFVDQGDRRGDHLLWDAMAGVIGLTAPWKRGAGSGYHVPATADIPADLAGLAAVGGTAVSAHLGQEGSLYDVFNVRMGENAGAGHLGSRDGAPCVGLATGKCSTAGPTRTWLRELYQHLFVSCADLESGTWGPYPDQTDGDIPMFEDFIGNPAGAPGPRTLIVAGADIVGGTSSGTGSHPTFFPTHFDAGFVYADYRSLSETMDDVPDLVPAGPIGGGGDAYGLWNPCFIENDVLSRLGSLPGSTVAATYEDPNPLDSVTYPAAIYAPEDPGAGRVARTLVMGFTHGLFGGLGSRYTAARGGYHAFWLNALTGLIGTVCGTTLSAPVGVGDGGGSGKAFTSFMNLRSANPARAGAVAIEFGIARAERVEVRVYDVRGRLVRTVADRMFEGGVPHRVVWDGRDDAGRKVASGVYFHQLRAASFTGRKKLTVLRD